MDHLVEIKLQIRVQDKELLMEYATKQYLKWWSWFENKQFDDVGEAVAEALVISNENPSPNSYGIEILEYKYRVLGETETIYKKCLEELNKKEGSNG
jgi:hypothetical protein